MVEKIAPVEYSEILKLFAVIMILQIIVVLVLPTFLLKTVVYFLLASIPISGFLAYYWYLKRRRTEFYYDSEQFTMKRGNQRSTHRWKEFSRVLLIKVRGREFLIRLFFRDNGVFDIATSRLRVNPFSFRVKILKLVEGAQQ